MKKAKIIIGVGNHMRPATQEELARPSLQRSPFDPDYHKPLICPPDRSLVDDLFDRLLERLGWKL